jgi:UDP-glucose 4-epimerase
MYEVLCGGAGVRILLAGGVGFIGAHLARLLLDAGHAVTCLDAANLNSTDNATATPAFQQRSALIAGATVVRGDVAVRGQWQRVFERFDPDCVCYLAAVPLVDKVTSHPEAAARSMSAGLVNGLEITRASSRRRRFVYVSSSMVYGHFASDPLPEDALTNPVNLYGALKLAGEILTHGYLTGTQHEAVVVRPIAVYGPTDIHGRVVQKCCEAALTDKPFTLNAAESRIDFTWVGDLAAGVALAATTPGAAGETFNLAFGCARSLEELVELVRRHSGGLSVVHVNKKASDRPRRGALDIGKAARLLGYAPQMDLEAGIVRYLDFLKNSALCRPAATGALVPS